MYKQKIVNKVTMVNTQIKYQNKLNKNKLVNHSLI